MGNNSNGLSLSLIIFVVFLTLKLSNVIDWSWWWITSPLWIPFAVFIAIVLILFLFALISIVINDRNVD